MGKLTLFFATLVLGAACQAGQINCEGDYLFYHMNAKAKSSGSKVVGPISIAITSSVVSPQHVTMDPISSDIREGQYLRATGHGSTGGGTISADFDQNSQSYRGTLSAQTPLGTLNVGIECSVARAMFSQFDEQGDFDGIDF